MASPATPTAFAVSNKAICPSTAELPTSVPDPNVIAAVRLAWGSEDVTANYRVEYRLSVDTAWTPGAITPLGAASATIFDLETGTDYDFRVRGENGDGDSAWVELSDVTMGAPAASPFDDLAPIEITITPSDTSALVAFGPLSEGREARCNVSVLLGGERLFSAGVGLAEIEFLIESLEPATIYTLEAWFSAYDEDGILRNGPTTTDIFTTEAAGAGAESGMTGPDEITGHLFAGLAADFTLDPAPAGSATWSISGAPGGVEINGTGTLNVTGRVTGEPSAAGLFDAIVFATWTDAGNVQSASRPVRFLIEGGAFLPWLSGDASTVDLQADFGTRVMTSSRAESGTLWLKRGDAFEPLVIFRDGQRILAPAITELRLRLRLADNSAAPPLVDVRTTPPAAEFFDGHRAYRLRATLSSALITRVFSALGAASVACQLELSWKLGGKWASSKFLTVTLADDAIRH